MSGSHFLSYLSSPFEGKVYEFRRGLTIFSWRTFLKSDSYLLFGFNKNLFRCHTLPSGKRSQIWTHFRGTVPCLSVRIVITVWRKSWWVSMWIDHFQPRNFFHLGLSGKLPKWCPNLHLKLRRENYLSKDVLTIFAQKYPTNFDPEFTPFLLLNFKYITKTANLFHIHEHFLILYLNFLLDQILTRVSFPHPISIRPIVETIQLSAWWLPLVGNSSVKEINL